MSSHVEELYKLFALQEKKLETSFTFAWATGLEAPATEKPHSPSLGRGFSAVSQCISEDLCGVEGGFFCAVVDLVAAAGAGGGDEDFGVEFFQMGKENELADLHRDLVMFLFVAK